MLIYTIMQSLNSSVFAILCLFLLFIRWKYLYSHLFPPYFPRRTPIYLMKHSIKQFIIGKSMPFSQFHNSRLRIANFLINIHHPHLIQVLCECNSHIFLKEPAEIFTTQIKMRRDIFQRDCLYMMKFNIFRNLAQPFQNVILLWFLRNILFFTKRVYQFVKNIDCNGVALQFIPHRLLDI